MVLEELSMPGNTFSAVSLIITSIICRKPGNPAANPPCTVGKTGATDPDPGDDFAAVPFTFSAPRSPGMGSRLAEASSWAYSPGSAIKSWSIWDVICVERTCYRARFTGSVCAGALSLVYWYDRQH